MLNSIAETIQKHFVTYVNLDSNAYHLEPIPCLRLREVIFNLIVHDSNFCYVAANLKLLSFCNSDNYAFTDQANSRACFILLIHPQNNLRVVFSPT